VAKQPFSLKKEAKPLRLENQSFLVLFSKKEPLPYCA